MDMIDSLNKHARTHDIYANMYYCKDRVLTFHLNGTLRRGIGLEDAGVLTTVPFADLRKAGNGTQCKTVR